MLNSTLIHPNSSLLCFFPSTLFKVNTTFIGEKKVLIHIPYQTSIIPIRHPKPDMSPALAAEFADSEIKRFDREMCNALSISLK